MANTAQNNSSRLWLIDFVRLVSITLVLISHTNIAGAISGVGWCWTHNGRNAVSLFFLVSGFVIARAVAHRDGALTKINLRNFYVMRAARILPLALSVIVLGVLLSKAHFQFGMMPWLFGKTNWHFWLAMFTLTLNWALINIPEGQGFGMYWAIYWSLAIEEQFYLFFPLCGRLAKTEKRLVYVLVALLLIAPIGRAVVQQLTHHDRSGAVSSFVALDLMSAGVLLHLTLQRYGEQLRARPHVAWSLFAAGTICLLAIFTSTQCGPDYLIAAPTGITIGLFSFLLGGLSIPRIQTLPRFLVAGGELSYGAYLLHCTMIGLIGAAIKPLPFAVGFPIFWFATMGVAWLSYRFVESKANTAIRRRFIRKPEAIPSAAPTPDRILTPV